MSGGEIAAIEARRIAAGLTVEELAGRAEINPSTYRRNRSGATKPRKATIALLKRALTLKERHREAVRLAPEAAFRTMVGALAEHHGHDPQQVLAHDPSRRATADAEWMAAARMRRIALHILNGGAGMGTNALADAAGMTPAAVSLGIRAVEDERDADPKLDALLDRMHSLIHGGPC